MSNLNIIKQQDDEIYEDIIGFCIKSSGALFDILHTVNLTPFKDDRPQPNHSTEEYQVKKYVRLACQKLFQEVLLTSHKSSVQTRKVIINDMLHLLNISKAYNLQDFIYHEIALNHKTYHSDEYQIKTRSATFFLNVFIKGINNQLYVLGYETMNIEHTVEQFLAMCPPDNINNHLN